MEAVVFCYPKLYRDIATQTVWKAVCPLQYFFPITAITH
jgi:hypothetical protein